MALSGSSFDATPGDGSPVPFEGATLSSTLTVVSTSPGPSSILASSPLDLFVTFDRPIEPFSLGNDDFDLVHVAADGSTTFLGIGESHLSEALDPNDPTGSRIDLTLSTPLLPGHYGLQLDAGSLIQGLDGSSPANNVSDTLLSDFTVSSPKTGLAGAVDLGTIGSTETVHSGVLDLANDPGQVQYYQINVAPGHHWRLGVEIAAQRDGSPLASTLSLFDAKGRLISTSSAGLLADPGDPYLFAGLTPGTYYVGVSGRKNIPDASGTYDTSRTVVGASQAGGPFQITLVADAADQATRLLGVRVDHADPISTRPTGLTLQFSGAIAVAGIQNPALSGLTLVDQGGKSWPITLVHYDASLAQLSIVFNQALPSGNYALQVSTKGGLVDLSGNHPIGTGLYPSVLGSFSFIQQPPVAGDLGPIYTDVASSGLDTKVEVSPGKATVEQFVVVKPGVYVLGGLTGTGNVNFSVLDAGGNILASGPGASGSGTAVLTLPAGVYRIELTNTDSVTAWIDQTIVRKETQLSSLLVTGVAQGPALNLRLVTPQANFGQVSNDLTQPTNPAPTVPNTQESSHASQDSRSGGSTSSDRLASLGSGVTLAVGLSVPAGPSVAGLLYGSGPVGRPSSTSNQIGAVGPTGPSGLVAIASSSAGLPPGLISVPEATGGGDLLEPEADPLDPEVKAGGPGVIRGTITTESGLLARAPGSRREDDRTLEQADWIGQLVSNALGWVEKVAVDRGATLAVPPAEAVATPPTDRALEVEESRLEAASFSSPVVIGVVLAAVTYRYRRNFLARVRLRPRAVSRAGFKPILVGPHRRSRIRVR